MPDNNGPASAPKLVVVTGAGRSGTSTVAGALKKLGLSIPQPELRADHSNPRGFFEPLWVVKFHKRLLLEADIGTLDARPRALAKATKVGARPDVRRELRDWLGEHTEPQFVVKDPRAFWVNSLWRETAEELEVQLNQLTMLRHPAEVVGSWRTHYAKTPEAAERRSRETGLLAGWVNAALFNEKVFRGDPRVFVHYADLLRDWRQEMSRISATLDLQLNTDPASREPHPVDEFIDVGLHRVRVTFDDLHVPDSLAALADETWSCLAALADPAGDHDTATIRMDTLREEYDVLYDYSKALVRDATEARLRQARARTRQQVEAELRENSPTSNGLPRRVLSRARRMWSASSRD